MHLDDETALRTREFYPANRAEWKCAVERVRLSAHRRIRRLPTRFEMATRNAIQHWEASAKKVLRVPSTTRFPQGLIGLLMRCI